MVREQLAFGLDPHVGTDAAPLEPSRRAHDGWRVRARLANGVNAYAAAPLI
jgi:hypothetical protein